MKEIYLPQAGPRRLAPPAAIGLLRRCLVLARRAPGPLFLIPLLILGLGACGQKGPLQIPGQSKDTPWPVRLPPGPAPAAPPADPQAVPSSNGAAAGASAGGSVQP